MTNFVRDNTSLAFPKISWDGLSDEVANPTMHARPIDWNALCQGAYDLRGWIQTGLTPGSYTRVSITVDADGRIVAVSSGAAAANVYDTIIDVTGTPISSGVTYNNWNIGTLGQNTLVKYITDGTPNGANSRGVRGLVGGATGKLVTFLNMAPTGQNGAATFAHEDGSASAGNQFHNSGGGTQTGGSLGSVTYYYDGLWRHIWGTQ